MKRIITIACIAMLGWASAMAQTEKFVFEGGYFLRNGSSWEEHSAGITTDHYNYDGEDRDFYFIRSTKYRVKYAIPKNIGNKIFSSKLQANGNWSEWEPSTLLHAAPSKKIQSSDGKVFYLIEKGKRYGIVNQDGVIIIPTTRNYSDIGLTELHGRQYFSVKKTDIVRTVYVGCCDIWGREIISPDRLESSKYLCVLYSPDPSANTYQANGLFVIDYQSGGKITNFGIFLDYDNRAYTVNGGTKKYISDRTNGEKSVFELFSDPSSLF